MVPALAADGNEDALSYYHSHPDVVNPWWVVDLLICHLVTDVHVLHHGDGLHTPWFKSIEVRHFFNDLAWHSGGHGAYNGVESSLCMVQENSPRDALRLEKCILIFLCHHVQIRRAQDLFFLFVSHLSSPLVMHPFSHFSHEKRPKAGNNRATKLLHRKHYVYQS